MIFGSRSTSSPLAPFRRALTAFALGGAVSIVGLSLAVLVQACGSDADSDSTGGKVIVLHTRLELNPVAESEFTSSFGWRVTLDKALIATGPFYYFDGAPPLVLNPNERDFQYAARLLGLGTAHAHPGHYQPGNAMGQMLESSSVDLFAGGSDYPDGEGITGTFRSARFSFADPKKGPLRAELALHAVIAEGKAERDGEPPRYFRAIADLADIEKNALDGGVDGCELSRTDVERDGTITVTVNPKIWFDLVNFTEVAEASADEPGEFEPGSRAQVGFFLGLAQLSAYKFSYSKS